MSGFVASVVWSLEWQYMIDDSIGMYRVLYEYFIHLGENGLLLLSSFWLSLCLYDVYVLYFIRPFDSMTTDKVYL